MTKGLPPIPRGLLPDGLDGPIRRMHHELMTLLGHVPGGGMALTIGNTGSSRHPRTGVVIVPGTGEDDDVDLTPPPDVSGLTADASFSHVIAQWVAATYTQGHGHKRTNIYAAKRTPGAAQAVFSDATRVTEAWNPLNIVAIPSDMNTRWHIWAKHETVDGVESLNPAGGTNGVVVTTGQDIAQLMDLLNGQITAGDLHSSLGARIDLIDASSSVTNSVAWRVAQEEAARILQDNALSTAISQLAVGAADGFDPSNIWYYDTTAEGWTASNGTATITGGWLVLDGNAADPRLTSPTVAIVGSRYNVVKARIRRDAGSGWTGRVYYSTAGHGFSASYYKAIADPGLAIGAIGLVEFDMANLTAGGTDWIDSTITGLRFDLGVDGADTIAFDWSAVGRNSPGASTAALGEEATLRAAADSAEVALREALSTKLTGLNDPAGATLASLTSGLLYDERVARSNADGSEVTARQLLSTMTTGAADPTGLTLGTLTAGLIFDEKTARSNVDSAHASSITALEATVNNATTGLPATRSLLLNSYSTTSTMNSAIASAVGVVSARLNSGGDTYNSIVTATNTANAANTTANSANTTANTAASSVTTLQSRIDSGNAAAFQAERTWDFQSTLDGWGTLSNVTLGTATDYMTVNSTGSDPQFASPGGLLLSGALHNKVRARVMRTGGSGWDGTLYYTTIGGSAHGFSSSFRKTIADTTVLNQWVELEWDMEALTAGGTDWTTNTIGQLRVDLGTGSADDFRIDWFAVGSRGHGVAASVVSQEINTRADETGHLGASYTLRVQTTQGGRTVVGGFGITGTSAPGAGPEIEMGVRADRFWIGAPAGSTGVSDIVPFVVQTSDQVVNGVTVPRGVYMDAVFIKNVQAITARLGTAWIDNAMVANMSVSKLTAGSITAGAFIQSPNFVAGSAGWRIHGNGSAEFSNVVIRGATYTGTIFAGSGTIGGITLSANSIFSTNFVAGSAGFRLNSSGLLEGNNVSLRGAINGGSFTGWAWPAAGLSGFHLGPNGLLLGNLNDNSYVRITSAGDFSAPGLSIVNGVATFSGSLTAAAINAVNTINIAGNAVTVPTSAQIAASNIFFGQGQSHTTSINLLSHTTAAVGAARVVLIIGSPGNAYLANSTNSVGDGSITIRLKRNSTVLVSVSGSDNAILYPLVLVDTPGNSVACTYSLEIVNVGNGNQEHIYNAMHAVALESKR